VEDLPPEIVSHTRPARSVNEPAAGTSAVEALFDRMVRQRESFWSVVYPGFMARDITRTDVRVIVTKGLQKTAGSYKMLVELLSMESTDDTQFLKNFLRKRECHVPFERVRSTRVRQTKVADADFPAVCVPDNPNAIDENLGAIDHGRR
jgi:hypothetical protein